MSSVTSLYIYYMMYMYIYIYVSYVYDMYISYICVWSQIPELVTHSLPGMISDYRIKSQPPAQSYMAQNQNRRKWFRSRCPILETENINRNLENNQALTDRIMNFGCTDTSLAKYWLFLVFFILALFFFCLINSAITPDPIQCILSVVNEERAY